MCVDAEERWLTFRKVSGLLVPSVNDDAAKLRSLFDVALDHGLVALVVHYVDEVR